MLSTNEAVYEFNIWVCDDGLDSCDAENSSRGWFNFRVKGIPQFKRVKFNIMNLTVQSKLFDQWNFKPLYTTNQSQNWSPVERCHVKKLTKNSKKAKKEEQKFGKEKYILSFTHYNIKIDDSRVQ